MENTAVRTQLKMSSTKEKITDSGLLKLVGEGGDENSLLETIESTLNKINRLLSQILGLSD